MTVPQSIALVDLSCIFKKNYHAPNPGVLGGAEKALDELSRIRESVAHMILCLDWPPYERRKAIFPEYKGHRPPPSEAEKYQKRWLYEQCKKRGYQMARVRGEEADDVIATLARIYGRLCPDVRLVGADKDLAQCVTANVRQLTPPVGERPAELRGPEEVVKKFEVRPDQIPLYLALVGDKSDNVPGVPGIGQVKAAWLIKDHQTFFDLGEAVALRPSTGQQPWKALKENWAQLEMSLELVTLKTDLQLDADALLVPLEPEPVETMGEADVELDGLMGNETPMPTEPDWDRVEQTVQEQQQAELPPPRVGKDPAADEVLRKAVAERNADRAALDQHAAEQRREESWREQMRKEMEEGAQERPANDQRPASTPPSGPRAVPDAEFDPIGKSPGASGPLPPKAAARPETKAIVKAPADYGLVTQDLQPQDLKSAEVISKWLLTSGLYPQFRSAAAIFAVIMRGKELGLGVTTALAGFHVVEGKPTASADLIRSLATRSSKCKYFRLVHSDDTYAEWETLHADHPEPTRYRYTIEEANDAGLRGGNWQKRKRDMLCKSAAAKLARIVYPGEVLGLYEPTEFETYGEEAA